MAHSLTLDQIITEACEQFAPADAPTRYYSAALHHGHAFRREWLAGTGRVLKTTDLHLGDDRTVALPDDYVEYTMLGLKLPGWGGVRNLVYNSRLSLLPGDTRTGAWAGLDAPDEVPDFLQAPTAAECATACYGALDADADAYCGYGGAWYAGEFRIDRAEGRIVCGSQVPGTAVLVLEYYAFAACDGEDIALDPLVHSWGLNYVLWKLHLQKKDLGMAREFERLTRQEETRYRDRTRNFSLGGAMQVKHMAAAQRWK